VLSYTHHENNTGYYEGVFVKRLKNSIFSPFKIACFLMKKRRSVSILHIHTPSRIGKLAVFIGFLLRYRVIFKFPNEHLLNGRNLSDRMLWRSLFFMVDLFVVLEEDTKNILKRRAVSDAKVFCVENGVEMSAPKKLPESDSVRLIFVGRLTPQKACDQLIHACSLLKKGGVSFSLDVVGEGDLSDELSSLACHLGLSDHINFIGYQDRPLELMKKSDILVLPSLKEGMSNVLLEAISIGLPIVATDVGSASKQLGTYGEKFLCKPSEAVCLADKIQLLAKDKELRDEYGSYLYKRGVDVFSIDTISEKYIQAYKEVV
ncbi:glycosyltransferase, partial [Salinivibrio sp. IB282]|uniref:glycosyltransferase n=1 Tax=Salinivibrio sp. IB282 TaxID=1766122 RepID=UPI000988375A